MSLIDMDLRVECNSIVKYCTARTVKVPYEQLAASINIDFLTLQDIFATLQEESQR